MTSPVRVGLVGGGTWARRVYAPMFAGGPGETTLAAVWTRRPEPRSEIAAEHGAVAVASFDELLASCDAVAFAVPPAVQAELAPLAAAAGKPLLLEKPLAEDLDGARRVADAVAVAGVVSMVGLTYRYLTRTREFLSQAVAFGAVGGRGCFLSGAYLGADYGTSPWRHAHGALLDVGPHLVDLLVGALGPVVDVRGRRSPGDWVSIVLEHESGAVSEAALCCRAAITSRTEVELYAPEGGCLVFDGRAGNRDDFTGTLRREFADAARTGNPHPIDAAHALRLQEVLARAAADIG